MTEAWYLGCRPDDVAERAVLVGDPGRIDLFADQLEEVRPVGDNRGLRTITGRYGDLPVTVCAFGMGAPVAAVVLDELAQLGVTAVLRVGTVMALQPGMLGELVLASGAIREESVSHTYVPASVPALADLDLLFGTIVALERSGERYRTGLVASLDGFYTEMFAARPERERSVAGRLSALADLGAIAADMETSAVLAIGRRLQIAAGSLCLATVDAATRAQLDERQRVGAERRLVGVTLAAITTVAGALRQAAADQAHALVHREEE